MIPLGLQSRERRVIVAPPPPRGLVIFGLAIACWATPACAVYVVFKFF